MNAPTTAADPTLLAESACYDPIREAIAQIELRLHEGPLNAVTVARSAHAELIRTVGLAEDPPGEWQERADRLEQYRRALASEVLKPMRTPFGEGGPSAAITTVLNEALAAATEGARALPADVDGAWPANALAVAPWDDLATRSRKAFARVFSAARKAGEARSVPIRAVALEHLSGALAELLDAGAIEAVSEWAAWERQVGVAWIEWGESALSALVRGELPDEEPDPKPKARATNEEGEPAGVVPWVQLRDAATALDSRLASLVETCPVASVVETLLAAVNTARDRLEGDVAVAGSLVFDPKDTHLLEPELARLERMRPALATWDDAVHDRLHLYEALLSILAGATAVQRRLVIRVREEHLSDTGGLVSVADRLEALGSRLQGQSRELQRELSELDAAVRRELKPTTGMIPLSSAVDASIQKGSNATVDALLAMIRQAPGQLDLLTDDARIGRKVETRALAFQELARQGFDAMRIERIRSSTHNLVESIEQVRSDVGELPDVFAFAYDAAQTELKEAADGAEERAVGLVTEALASMADSLRNAEQALHAAVRRAQARLAAEVSEGSLGLIDRVGAGRVQARLLAARSQFSELRAWLVERWGPPVVAATRWVVARLRVVQRLATKGLRKGTAIVGTGPATGVESARTLRPLAFPNQVLKDLPLVYQRLFTLGPISDPSLLAGRQGELAQALDRWQRWQADDGIPLMVKGQPGTGVTSFLNVLGAKITEDGGSVAQVALDSRLSTEGQLARRIAEALGVHGVGTLDELAAAIFGAPKGGLPEAVTVDNLEHLYMRVPGGTDLVERLLTLMSETEPRILWIGGVTQSAWQLIATAEPTAVSQVELFDLKPLSEEGIREVMTARHRRSGLPLRFQEPESGRRVLRQRLKRLRQRLKRLRDRAGYDELLADAFFSQLERTSSRHLRLALFQWMRAADFSEGDGVLMRTPEKPDFSVLDSLALNQNFTLKAFLEHRTLTLGEHDSIFRLPRHESYQIFESLQNRQILETVGADDEITPERSEIEDDLRYRVRPLLAGAVVAHLRGRNIFH